MARKKKPLPPNKEMIENVISSLYDSFISASEQNNELLMIKLSPELHTWIKLNIEYNKDQEVNSVDKVKEEWIKKLKDS